MFSIKAINNSLIKRVGIVALILTLLAMIVSVSFLFVSNTSADASSDWSKITVRADYTRGSDTRVFDTCTGTWDNTDFKRRRRSNYFTLRRRVRVFYNGNESTIDTARIGSARGQWARRYTIYNSEKHIFNGASSLEDKERVGRNYARRFGVRCIEEQSSNDRSQNYQTSDNRRYTGRKYRFNFGKSDVVEGHILDYGEQIKFHNGLRYGWNNSNHDRVEDQDKGGTAAQRGYAEFSDNDNNKKWILEDIQPGYYEVNVVAGGTENGRQHVTINGNTVINCESSNNTWCENSTRMYIGGRAEMRRGNQGNNVRVNAIRFLEVR